MHREILNDVVAVWPPLIVPLSPHMRAGQPHHAHLLKPSTVSRVGLAIVTDRGALLLAQLSQAVLVLLCILLYDPLQ